MIKIDAAEANELQEQFAGFPDRTIIRELVRRNRLRQASANVTFYPEMRADERYMDGVRERLMMTMTRAIADNDDVKPALIGEHPGLPKLVAVEPDTFTQRPGSMVMTADIVFLVGRNKAEG